MGMPLLVVRHAHAGRRSAYRGDDRTRPLSPRGVERARELIPLLAEYRPQRILSSPYVRCFATVQPLAESLGLAVESVDELAEGHGAEAVRLLATMAGESAVLCTHGDVATEMLEALMPDAKDSARKSFRLQKGEVWVVQSSGSRAIIAQHLRRLPASGQGPSVGA
jgi:phosphohistidine phosphatase SixA